MSDTKKPKTWTSSSIEEFKPCARCSLPSKSFIDETGILRQLCMTCKGVMKELGSYELSGAVVSEETPVE